MPAHAVGVTAPSSKPSWIQRSLSEAPSSSHRQEHSSMAESPESSTAMAAGLAALALVTLPAFGLLRHAQAVLRTACILMRVLPASNTQSTLQSLSPAVQAWLPAVSVLCASMLLALLGAAISAGPYLFMVAASYTVTLCGGEFAACVAAARQRPAAGRARRVATAAGIAGLQAFLLLQIWRELCRTNSAWLLAIVAGNGMLCCLSSLAALTSP